MVLKAVCMLYVVVSVLSAPPPPPPAAPDAPEASSSIIPIISQTEELEPNGTYKFSYETGNGIKREETSYDKTIPAAKGRSVGEDDSESSGSEEIHVQEGSYSYTAPDGTIISLRYTADENGFRPIGSHIPTAPPLPDAIKNSLNEQTDSEPTSGRKAGKALKENEVPAAAPASKDAASAVDSAPADVAAKALEVAPTEAAESSSELTSIGAEAPASESAPTDAPSAESTPAEESAPASNASSVDAAEAPVSTTASDATLVTVASAAATTAADASEATTAAASDAEPASSLSTTTAPEAETASKVEAPEEPATNASASQTESLTTEEAVTPAA